MAVGILKYKLQRSFAFSRWTVESAGLQGLVGQPADLNAQVAMEAYGLDISRHIARRVSRNLVSQYDLVITVERQQKQLLDFAFSEFQERFFFIGDLAGVDQDIVDPLSKPLDSYLSTLRSLNEILEKGFLRIILLAMYYSLRVNVDGIEYVSIDQHKSIRNKILDLGYKDPVSLAIQASEGFPNEFRYEVMLLLTKLYPQDDQPVQVLRLLAISLPPSEEEKQWLKVIQLRAIVTPLTGLSRLNERIFIHPDIQSELNELRLMLTDPTFVELYKELEFLFSKNLPSHIYRASIWDLTSKYDSLPYKVGDYEQAYIALRGES
jgi:protein-tyrosine phosphatase